VLSPFLGTIRISKKPAAAGRPIRQRPNRIAIIARKHGCHLNQCDELQDLFLIWSPAMSMQRIVGIVLLVAGVVFLIIGMNPSHSAADQLSNTFTGRFTQQTAWYVFGGGTVALVGLLIGVFAARSRSA